MVLEKCWVVGFLSRKMCAVDVLPCVMLLLYDVERLCGLYDVEASDNMVVVVVALWQKYIC